MLSLKLAINLEPVNTTVIKPNLPSILFETQTHSFQFI